ncbi:sterol carrier protein 2 [Homalodisca vitripennis]|nr:sterol carrier protein 2 [Homalodisca vitripennis]
MLGVIHLTLTFASPLEHANKEAPPASSKRAMERELIAKARSLTVPISQPGLELQAVAVPGSVHVICTPALLINAFWLPQPGAYDSRMVNARSSKAANWVRRLSQDNQIKQRRAWLLLGQVTAERSCPCKRPACLAIGGGSEVTFKPLVPRLSVREGFLALTSPDCVKLLPAFDIIGLVRSQLDRTADLALSPIGDSASGQRALYEAGIMNIPIFNVNNNCSTGSSALMLAKQIIQSGNASCVLALGFEKMERGSLSSKFDDRTNPMDKHVQKMVDLVGLDAAPLTAQLFGNAGIEHMARFGTTPQHMAKIAYKNHKHSVNNPYSQFQEEYSMDMILQSPRVFGPLTKLQCCPTSDGSAAAILANEEFVIQHGLQANAVLIVGMEMCSDLPTTFSSNSLMNLVGYDMTRCAAQKLFSKTNYRPADVDVIELHDCFSANEMITYEALGLCPPGRAGEFIDSGNNTYGGRHVVNPSGGLISKGHPLGATGIAQCAELCWQLRGLAGRRQVPGACLALQHNIGLGGAVVVALYQKAFPGPQIGHYLTGVVEDPSVFKATPLFAVLEGAMKDDKENLIEKVRGIYCFKVKNSAGNEGMWIINAKVGKGKVEYNGKGNITYSV